MDERRARAGALARAAGGLLAAWRLAPGTLVGLAAATQQPQNLADAQNHPAFAWRPETGEDAYASMLAVPVRRAGWPVG